MLRSFLLSLSPILQLFTIVFGTIVVAFTSALVVYLIFGSFELISKAGLITGVYTVLGTIYAVLIAFSVSGVWQNYTAAELTVATEAAALIDLLHMMQASSEEKAARIRKLVIEYLTECLAIEWPTFAEGKSELIMLPTSPTYILTMNLVREVQSIQPTTARDNVIFSHSLTLLTKWLDARRKRIMLAKGNIAQSLWPVLIAGAFILFAFHGMFIVNNYLLWMTLLLFFSGIIGCAFYLIFTLDSPFSGVPAVGTGPFSWVLSWIKAGKI